MVKFGAAEPDGTNRSDWAPEGALQNLVGVLTACAGTAG